MPKLTITGAKGRMGRALIRCAGNDPQLEVVGAVDLGDEIAPAIEAADVVIDYGLMRWVAYGTSSTMIDFRRCRVVRRGSCFDLIAEVCRRHFGIELEEEA